MTRRRVVEHAHPVDPNAANLLRLFVDKLGGQVHFAVHHGSGKSEHWETFIEIEEVGTGFIPEQGGVELELRDDQQVRLHFNEAELLELLNNAGEASEAVWGEPLSDEESAA